MYNAKSKGIYSRGIDGGDDRFISHRRGKTRGLRANREQTECRSAYTIVFTSGEPLFHPPLGPSSRLRANGEQVEDIHLGGDAS